jgi:hypothetical protein
MLGMYGDYNQSTYTPLWRAFGMKTLRRHSVGSALMGESYAIV